MKLNFINIMAFFSKVILIVVLSLSTPSIHAKNAYTIEAELFPKAKAISGQIQMEFTNNSNDTLQELWIHLWPNAYQDNYTPFTKQMIALGETSFKYNKSYGAIRGLNFTSNQETLTFIQSEDQPDIGLILLNQPLLPLQSISIHTPFKVKLPQLISRSGYGNNFFAVAQWYPKFAIYENGKWQTMSYLEQGEFYSDFAKYDVKITVPTEYKFAATGYRYQEIDTTQSQQTYHIIQDNIHDFAWFAAKDFEINTKEIKLPSGKKVLVQSYTLSNHIHHPIIRYTEKTLQYMSANVGEYPYDICTVVETTDGVEAGMEYPTITLIKNSRQLLKTVVHEVVHNWWYGILANNERAEPFLDESFTSYYEDRVIDTYFPDSWYNAHNRRTKINQYIGLKNPIDKTLTNQILLNQYRLNQQQPLNLHSEQYTKENYGLMLYVKGSLDIKKLENYLGKKEFDNIIKSFYKQYQFSHISFQDIQNHFKINTNKDVSWFFEDILKSNHLPDIAIHKIDKKGGEIAIVLKNKTNVKTPVQLSVTDKKHQVLRTITTDAFDRDTKLNLPFDSNAYAVWADKDFLIAEQNKRNNYAKIKGLQKWKPLQIRAFGALEDPTKNQIFLSPVFGGNKYDGFMFGAAIYNHILPVKNLEYDLVPLYAFKSKQFNWIGNIAYHILPKTQKPLDIEIGIHSKSFSQNDRILLQKYKKLQPFIELTFKDLNQINGLTHRLGYRNVQIWDEGFIGEKDTITDEVIFSKTKGKYNTNEFWYSLENKHVLYPTFLQTTIRFDKNYLRQSLEVKQKIRYTKNGSFVHLRFFAGAFYYKNKNVSFRRNQIVGFNISGINGANDYLYDGYYFGRSENQKFTSRQLMMGEGNFKVLTTQQSPMEGKTVNGLFALNFKIDAPVKWLPIQLFVDMGYSVDKNILPENLLPTKQFHYDLGFNFSFLNEAIEIYFPLLMSDNFKTYYKSNLPKFGQRISFSIDLSKFNISQNLRKDWTKRLF